jgi:amino acid adenylation domain-containing protein
VNSLLARIAALSSEQRALLVQRLREQELCGDRPRILAQDRSLRTFPLSSGQERLWFLQQLDPDSPAYNIPAAVRFIGSLDAMMLRRSLQEITRRHEALRTTFISVDGQPVQVVQQSVSLPLPVVDLRGMPPAERDIELQTRAVAEAQRPFDLSQGPLLRTTLLRLGDAEHVLLLTLHHIIADGWSMGVFAREVAVLYEAFATDRPSPLPRLPIQYVDYAVWQRDWLQGAVLETQLAYWMQQLSGNLPVLQLHTDRPRPPVLSYRGARQTRVLSKHLAAALKALGQGEGATLFMTLLAAFQALLARYTGQEDILVGTPVANRQRPEIDGLIGFFVNTLVLRTDLSGDPRFRELLRRVREVALGAYAHQDLPFEQLVQAIQPARDVSRTPLFQVLFVLQNAPMPALSLSGLTVELLEPPSGVAKFDLTLEVTERDEGLAITVEYSTDLFEAATVTRLLEHYRTVLEGIVANPERRLSELPLLSEAERQQVLVEWNVTQAQYPKDTCIHELFEAQVERTPKAIAVVGGEERLSYWELNRRANRLAHQLKALGVGPEVVVGVCMERTVGLVVAVLGTLKAGGAYLPLDPGYPSERLGFMLADARVSVLVAQPELLPDLPPYDGQVVCLDASGQLVQTDDNRLGSATPDHEANLISGATAENLACVIYTSGSTGKPKGVMLAHRGVCNLAVAQARAFDMWPESQVLQFAAFSFDAAVSELFVTLLSGATLHVVSRDALLPGQPLAQLLRDQAITTVTLPPSALVALPHEDLPSLRTIIVAGEACPAEVVARWAPGRRFLNGYGMSEMTVCVSIGEYAEGSYRPTIGRPIANTQVYILDKHLQPVPIGVPGELYVGGAGLARGYLYRPELTAERFLPDPFSGIPGARLYKTGDLARYLPNGEIEFLGRVDHQVKIRGFRVELGEIEAVLGQHPAVRETVVMAREDAPGGKRLVAYMVADEPATTSELRRFLKDRLPDYMVPAAFVFLDALPLTPNRKVDRHALPPPGPGRPDMETPFATPRDSFEERLVDIWRQVLGLQRVGIHDNFFELGGHSLLAIQLLSRISTELHAELPLRRLFQSPTIAELATTIQAGGDGYPDINAATPLTSVPREAHRATKIAEDGNVTLTLPQGEPNAP